MLLAASAYVRPPVMPAIPLLGALCIDLVAWTISSQWDYCKGKKSRPSPGVDAGFRWNQQPGFHSATLAHFVLQSAKFVSTAFATYLQKRAYNRLDIGIFHKYRARSIGFLCLVVRVRTDIWCDLPSYDCQRCIFTPLVYCITLSLGLIRPGCWGESPRNCDKEFCVDSTSVPARLCSHGPWPLPACWYSCGCCSASSLSH